MRKRDGEVWLKHISGTDSKTLHSEIEENVLPGSTVYTDELHGYNDLENKYKHGKVNHSTKEFVEGMASTNNIKSAWAMLKRSRGLPQLGHEAYAAIYP